jgi:hypothetical protein
VGRYEPFKSFNAGLASFTPAFRCAVEAHSDLTAEWRLIRLEADERFEQTLGCRSR